MSDAVDWVTANQSASTAHVCSQSATSSAVAVNQSVMSTQSSVSPSCSLALSSGSRLQSAHSVCIPQTTSTVIRIPGQQIQLQDADTSTPPWVLLWHHIYKNVSWQLLTRVKTHDQKHFKRHLIGMSASCGHPLPTPLKSWTHDAASRHTTTTISCTRLLSRSL